MELFVKFRRRVLDMNPDADFGQTAGVFYRKRISELCEIHQDTMIPKAVILRLSENVSSALSDKGIFLFEKNVAFVSDTTFVELEHEEIDGISDFFRKFVAS